MRGRTLILPLSLLGQAFAQCVNDACLDRLTSCGAGCVADCNRWLGVTVTPAAITSTVTLPATSLATDLVIKRQDTQSQCPPPSYPPYAAACDDLSEYVSACSCIGAGPRTTTVAAPTATVTVTAAPDETLPSSITTTSESAITGSSVPYDAAIILSIVVATPTLLPRKRGASGEAVPNDMEKREPVVLGGFIGADNTLQSCTNSKQYTIINGTLASDDVLVSTYPGTNYMSFVPGVGGTITTEFTVIDSMLQWQNGNFSRGEAGFCQQPNGSVYVTFSTDVAPPNCVPVELKVYKANQCQNGVILDDQASPSTTPVSGASSITSATSTTLPTPSEFCLQASCTGCQFDGELVTSDGLKPGSGVLSGTRLYLGSNNPAVYFNLGPDGQLITTDGYEVLVPGCPSDTTEVVSLEFASITDDTDDYLLVYCSIMDQSSDYYLDCFAETEDASFVAFGGYDGKPPGDTSGSPTGGLSGNQGTSATVDSASDPTVNPTGDLTGDPTNSPTNAPTDAPSFNKKRTIISSRDSNAADLVLFSTPESADNAGVTLILRYGLDCFQNVAPVSSTPAITTSAEENNPTDEASITTSSSDISVTTTTPDDSTTTGTADGSDENATIIAITGDPGITSSTAADAETPGATPVQTD